MSLLIFLNVKSASGDSSGVSSAVSSSSLTGFGFFFLPLFLYTFLVTSFKEPSSPKVASTLVEFLGFLDFVDLERLFETLLFGFFFVVFVKLSSSVDTELSSILLFI
eukprot:NODE_191_length_13422_cov_1.451025.p11 type:complete len:107 gc:universal NODE_191_length_13422_cov_1.451025:2022-2342(+)